MDFFTKISLCLFVVGLFHACQKDYEYSFIDQKASGLIAQEDWNFVQGMAFQQEDSLLIKLLGRPKMTDSLCTDSLPLQNHISFWLKENTAVGVHPLDFNLTNYEGFTVDMYHYANDMHYTTTEGAVEIIEIDTILDLIHGRLDIYYNNKNRVNGNFTITYCD